MNSLRAIRFARSSVVGVATIAGLMTWLALASCVVAEQPRSLSPAFEKGRAFWCFQPIKDCKPPVLNDSCGRRNEIDDFIFARLEANHLNPSPPASRIDLVRRVYFDVTGLPPSPEQIKTFLDDNRPDAYERLVDQLLASPHFGERAAQHWLDVVRYGESEGFEYDRHIPGAWRYRDYVVSSFNQDKPFDRFVTEQVAGDEIAPGNEECESAAVFHRLGPVRRNAGNQNVAAARNEVLTERTDIVGNAFLGLTLGCARCHDHKFDPILQKDYYSLQAYLAATEEHDVLLASDEVKQEFEAKKQAITNRITELTAAQKAKGADVAKIKAEIKKLNESFPPNPPTIPSVRNDFEHRTEIHVLRRGIWENKGDLASPRPPTVMVSESVTELSADDPTPRTKLAKWLTDPANPLTARVIVNRIWQSHFGQGIVRTSNNFGINGERPTHPELLDYLATRLVQNGWRLKPLHRQILLSSAYRQSSHTEPDVNVTKIDADNRLLWRFPRRRLSAEEIRDSMLCAAGQLNPAIGGPSVMLPVDAELMHQLYTPSQWKTAKDPSELRRRSIYLFAKRNLHLPFMESFDQPALSTSCGRRESTTHAPQTLELLNGRMTNELAEGLAKRLEADCGSDKQRLITEAYELTQGRPATPKEIELGTRFLEGQPTREFALAIFNLNGFLYVQ